MNRYDDIFEGGIGPERKLDLPSSGEDAAANCPGPANNCITIEIVREDRVWVVMISETAGAVKASIFSFDSVSDGKDRSYRGWLVSRRLRGRKEDSAKAGTGS